jgi:hypothetical protein
MLDLAAAAADDDDALVAADRLHLQPCWALADLLCWEYSDLRFAAGEKAAAVVAAQNGKPVVPV